MAIDGHECKDFSQIVNAWNKSGEDMAETSTGVHFIEGHCTLRYLRA